MKTNELRIGNYYLSFGVDLKQVEQLHKDKILIDFTPIPITEEWLLNFGLTKQPCAYYYDEFIEVFLVKEGDCEVLHFRSTHLRDKIRLEFVHELQNLYFTLIGRELQLKLEFA